MRLSSGALTGIGVVAKRKTLFDDRPVEIAELTYVIKQDLSSLNSQISSLQSLSKAKQAQINRNAGGEQEGEHNKNVCLNSGEKSEDINTRPGCCSTTRQIGRRRRQFQRSSRSANEKHPSLALTDGKLRLISVISFTAFARLSTIRISFIPYPDKVSHPTARLSELKFRHLKPRPVVILSLDPGRASI